MDNSREEFLLRRCLKEEPGALKEAAQKYVPPVYGFLSVLVKNNSEIKRRLLRAAFAEALRSYIPGESPESFSSVVIRSLLQNLNTQKDLFETKQTFEIPVTRLKWIWSALGALPPDERILILLRAQLNFLFKEMAFILCKPVDVVKAELTAAQIHFRSEIDKIMKAKYDELRSGPPSNL